MIFFTSDEHYGHRNIIEYVKRPFQNAEIQTESLISEFNRKVSPNDHTWHLGDLIWQSLTEQEAYSILRRLNGTHSLIYGNHDKVIQRSEFLQSMFRDIHDLISLNVSNKQKLVLCHYAMRIWPNSHKGAWHLFGHSHGAVEGEGLSFDIGVDGIAQYAPMSLDEVRDEMMRRKQHHVIAEADRWPGKFDHLPEGSH